MRTQGIDGTHYPIIKVMLDRRPDLLHAKIDEEHFLLEEMMKANVAYTREIMSLQECGYLHGAFRVHNSLFRNKGWRTSGMQLYVHVLEYLKALEDLLVKIELEFVIHISKKHSSACPATHFPVICIYLYHSQFSGIQPALALFHGERVLLLWPQPLHPRQPWPCQSQFRFGRPSVCTPSPASPGSPFPPEPGVLHAAEEDDTPLISGCARKACSTAHLGHGIFIHMLLRHKARYR